MVTHWTPGIQAASRLSYERVQMPGDRHCYALHWVLHQVGIPTHDLMNQIDWEKVEVATRRCHQ